MAPDSVLEDQEAEEGSDFWFHVHEDLLIQIQEHSPKLLLEDPQQPKAQLHSPEWGKGREGDIRAGKGE